MALANKPNGLSPIGSVGSSPFNLQVNLYSIANDASNTYAIGDVVKTSGGTDAQGVPNVTKAASGNTPLGIIIGFRVADPGVSLVGANLNLNNIFLPKSAGQRYVYVCDDPDIIFEVQADSSATAYVIGATGTGTLHQNANLTITADDTTNLASSPVSSIVVTGASVATTNTLVVRLLGSIQREDNPVSSTTALNAYVRLKAKWNVHEYFGSFTGV
jgi:hypothetical protein